MNTLINHKYKLIEKIGAGNFGIIYKGENIRTTEKVAIKIEPIINQTKLIKNESIIYNYLKNIQGVPSVKWYGKDEINYYMVIDLLGPSLQKIKEHRGAFSLDITLQIGIKIVNLLKSIHEMGLVHRDIKPDNFLFGLEERKTQLYLIDFGFCKSYLDNNKNHIEMNRTTNLIGSQTYASINAHNFIELSRRDDLESLCYMLIYFINGDLVWQVSDLSKKNKIEIKKMKEMKERDNISKIPIPIMNVLKYVKSLTFKQEPDYVYILNTFSKETGNKI